MSELRVLWWNVDHRRSRHTERQADQVLSLDPAADVIALCELRKGAARRWRERLGECRYRCADTPEPDGRRLQVLIASRPPLSSLAPTANSEVRRGALSAARVTVDAREVDVHAVHVPNGSNNGWGKIDHLTALREAFEPPHERAQILCGDFKTPQHERPDGSFVTFGQALDGSFLERPRSRYPFTADRPWNPERWDAGERAVLDGLPHACDMPDAFRRAHPDAVEVTWVPGRAPEEAGRRLDHIFASSELALRSCRHLHGWRRKSDEDPDDWRSDHSPIEAAFELADA